MEAEVRRRYECSVETAAATGQRRGDPGSGGAWEGSRVREGGPQAGAEFWGCMWILRGFPDDEQGCLRRGVRATKVCLVKAMVFPVVMYGCES